MQGTVRILDEINNRNTTHKLMIEFLNALKNKLIVGSIFCVLERALEHLNHDILISKLETYGMTGADKELYQSCLKGR